MLVIRELFAGLGAEAEIVAVAIAIPAFLVGAMQLQGEQHASRFQGFLQLMQGARPGCVPKVAATIPVKTRYRRLP